MELKGDGGQIKINVLARANNETQDYWDANWLYSEIKIDVVGFKAFYDTNLRVDDFIDFVFNLEKLGNGEIKEIEFLTLEEGLHLKGNFLQESGNIEWFGEAKASDTKNSLKFNLITDYESINRLMGELKYLLTEYPLVGNKD